MVRGTRVTIPASVTLDATGAGEATVTARGELDVTHTRVSVGPAPGQSATVLEPTATLLLDGVEFESTRSGSSDQTETRYALSPGESVTCRWTGGDPGAVATVYVRGTQYPPQ